MSLEIWSVYLAAATGLSLTPGPNGLLALTHGANYGLCRTVWTILGGAFGFVILIAASLAGMGALLAASERAFNVAKWLGAAYLIYLGVRLWRSPPISMPCEPEPEKINRADNFRLFYNGLVVAVSNPKGLIFFAAFLPQFMASGVSFFVNLVIFGGTFVVVETIYELALAGMAQRIGPVLARYGRWFNRAAGLAFVGIGGALASVSR